MTTGTGRLWQALVALGLALTLPLVDANREHKVHNIVLYPNKQSWCTTRNISQVIAEPGCRQVTIDNNVCVGACFSYSIPHTEPSDPGEIIGPYCDSCQPSEVSYVSVKVDCTENPNGKTPYLSKHIQLIHNCSCTACEEQSKRRPALAETDQSQETSLASGEQPVHPMVPQQHHQQHEEQQQPPQHQQTHQPQQQQEQPQAQLQSQSAEDEASHRSDPHSDTIQDDIPEILEVVHYSENDTEPIRLTPLHDFQSHTGGTTYLQQQQLNHYEHNSHTDNVKRLLHQKITKLLRSIKETNSPADREQLVEMIRLIKGTSDRNWDELVVSLQSENSILDFNRLRTELVEEPEEPAGLVPGTDNAAAAAAATVAVADSTNTLPASSEEEPIPDLSASVTKKSDSIDDVAVAAAAATAAATAAAAAAAAAATTAGENDHRRLMQHQFDVVRHRAAQPALAELAGHEDHGHASPQQQQQQQHLHQHQHQHHTVGERIDAHHHLARGPHGALVIRADAADQEELRSHQNGHEVQEKINIHAHELKPNLAGLVVTYDHHRGERHHHHQHHQTTGGLEGGLGLPGTEQQGPAELQGSEHRSHPHHTQHQHHQAHGYHPHGHHGHRETGHQHHGSQAAPPSNDALPPTPPPSATTGETQPK